MKNLYIAGSLFNEAEVNQRIKEGNMIESCWRCYMNCNEEFVNIANKKGMINWRN